MASISEILMAQGQQAAQSKRARASAWQPFINQLANLPGQIMQDRTAARAAEDAASDRQQARDLRDVNLAKGVQDLEAGTRAAETATATADQKRQMEDVLGTEGVFRTDGTFDTERATSTARQKGYAAILDDVFAVGQEWNQKASEEQRKSTTFEQGQTDRRQVENQRGVRRMIGESVMARGGQLMTPEDRQVIQGMALQEGIELPKTLTDPPEPKLREVIVKGPNGRPVKKLVPEAELMQGVEQYQEPRAPVAAEPLEAVIGPDGNPTLVPRSQARGMRPATTREQPTEDERKTAGFYGQMSDAITILDELEGKLSEKELYQMQTLPQEGLIGMANRGELSEAAKRYLRAFEQFTESRLRPVSGAAINDAEYARDRRTYAKQYGETSKLAADRKAARERALGSLKTRAGRALPKEQPKDATDALLEELLGGGR